MNFVDFIFPKKCLGCGREGRFLCASCLSKVGKFSQVCIECQKPAIDGTTHVRCRRPQGLDGLVSVWQNKKVIKKTIKALKYKFASDVARELSELVVKYLEEEINAIPENVLLVPIPLHSKRENWRGFNQSEEIGRKIASEMGWRFSNEVLVRKEMRQPQVTLSKEERQKNIRGVFEVGVKFPKAKELNLPFLIFDDVATTGATLREAAKVLKRNGVEKVWGLTIAR